MESSCTRTAKLYHLYFETRFSLPCILLTRVSLLRPRALRVAYSGPAYHPL
jgi:hypothetical protein